MFSFYFRQILKPALLAIPSRGALNLHGSLLPRYRGRCPVNWVLVHGETETGVTLHYMEPTPDTGDIVAQRRVPITDDDTALTLNRKLGEAARELLRVTFPALLAGTAPRMPQDHTRATTFGGRRPEDGRLAWRRPARELYNLVRAVTHPYPGAFTTWAGTKLLVWKARPLDEPGERRAGTRRRDLARRDRRRNGTTEACCSSSSSSTAERRSARSTSRGAVACAPATGWERAHADGADHGGWRVPRLAPGGWFPGAGRRRHRARHRVAEEGPPSPRVTRASAWSSTR